MQLFSFCTWSLINKQYCLFVSDLVISCSLRPGWTSFKQVEIISIITYPYGFHSRGSLHMVKGCALFKNFVICCVLNPISSHWHLDPLFLCRGSSLTETLSGRWQTFLYLIFGPCIHFNNSIPHRHRSASRVFFMDMEYSHPHTHYNWINLAHHLSWWIDING